MDKFQNRALLKTLGKFL